MIRRPLGSNLSTRPPTRQIRKSAAVSQLGGPELAAGAGELIAGDGGSLAGIGALLAIASGTSSCEPRRRSAITLTRRAVRHSQRNRATPDVAAPLPGDRHRS